MSICIQTYELICIALTANDGSDPRAEVEGKIQVLLTHTRARMHTHTHTNTNNPSLTHAHTRTHAHTHPHKHKHIYPGDMYRPHAK